MFSWRNRKNIYLIPPLIGSHGKYHIRNKGMFFFCRVPWLSPKLFDNLTVTTLQTDVYAFGTTVWEMFNNGWGPLDVGQQLHDLRHDEVQ